MKGSIITGGQLNRESTIADSATIRQTTYKNTFVSSKLVTSEVKHHDDLSIAISPKTLRTERRRDD